MKIVYINPITTDICDDDVRKILEVHKDVDTQADVIHLEPKAGKVSTPFLPPIPDFYDDLFDAVKQGGRDGYDSIIIGCAADPGHREANYMSSVPVFGPLQAGLNMACLLGHRIGMLVPSHDAEERGAMAWHEETIRRYGISRDRITFRAVQVGHPPQEIMERYLAEKRWIELKEEVISRFRDSVMQDGIIQARKAIEEDHVDVLFFSCTLWGGLLSPIAQAVDVPVLDPVITVLKSAEMAIKARIS